MLIRDDDGHTGSGLKFLVADDHHLVREGLKLALRQIDDAVSIIEADSPRGAIEAYHANTDIDLVLLDLKMPGYSGLAVLEQFEQSCPDARIVVVSASYDLQTVQAAVRRGVLGFIPKLSGKDSLISALKFILAGGIYVPPEAMMAVNPEVVLPAATEVASNERAIAGAPPMQVVPSGAAAQTPRDAGLTARQIEVLRELLDGKSNKQICRDMNLAMGTVKGHVAAILDALQVGSRTEAIAAAVKLGWPTMLGDSKPLRVANGTTVLR